MAADNSAQADVEAFEKDDRENFAGAYDLAQQNHEKDLTTRTIGSTEEAHVVETQATEVINPVSEPLGVKSETETETEKDA